MTSTEPSQSTPGAALAPPVPSPRRAAVEIGIVLAVLVPLTLGARSAREAGWLGDSESPLAIPLTVLVMGLVALAVTTLVMRANGEGWASAGAGKAPLGLTIAFGAVATAACYAAAIVSGLFYVALSGFDLQAILAERKELVDAFAAVPTALVVPLALFVGVYEELLFRGFLLSRAQRALAPLGSAAGPASAVILTAVLFGVAHAYQGPLGVLQTGALGLVLGAVAAWRRSVWPGVLAHAAIDMIGLFAVKVLKPAIDAGLFDRLLEEAQKAQ